MGHDGLGRRPRRAGKVPDAAQLHHVAGSLDTEKGPASVSDRRHRELHVEPLQLGFGPFGVLGEKAGEVSELVLNPAGNVADIDIGRLSQGSKLLIQFAQLRLTCCDLIEDRVGTGPALDGLDQVRQLPRDRPAFGLDTLAFGGLRPERLLQLLGDGLGDHGDHRGLQELGLEALEHMWVGDLGSNGQPVLAGRDTVVPTVVTPVARTPMPTGH